MSDVLTADNIAAQRRRLVQRMDETATVLRESAARFRDANEAAAGRPRPSSTCATAWRSFPTASPR